MSDKIITVFITIVFITCFYFAACAGPLAPDRSQQVLDMLAVECQTINDYSQIAQYGDTSRYNDIREHLAVTINNISLLMNGYDNGSINELWNMYNQFGPDMQSAQSAADVCSNVRSKIYRKISSDDELNINPGQLNSFDDCARAGYHVNGGTCFIGGISVFDLKGNLIGYYYSDCFDNTGFHMGSCWDCFYGADNEGCRDKR